MSKLTRRTRIVAISAAVVVALGGAVVATNYERLGFEHEPR